MIPCGVSHLTVGADEGARSTVASAVAPRPSEAAQRLGPAMLRRVAIGGALTAEHVRPPPGTQQDALESVTQLGRERLSPEPEADAWIYRPFLRSESADADHSLCLEFL